MLLLVELLGELVEVLHQVGAVKEKFVKSLRGGKSGHMMGGHRSSQDRNR